MVAAPVTSNLRQQIHPLAETRPYITPAHGCTTWLYSPHSPSLAHHNLAHSHSLLFPGFLSRWLLLPANTFHGNPLRPPSRTHSPIDQGDLGPFLPSAAPVKLGEVSLKRVTRLLLGLLGQVKRLKREVREIKEAVIKTRTNKPPAPRATDPRGHKTPVVEATPRPLSKVDPIGSTSWVSFWPESSKGLPIFAQPTPVQAVPLQVPSPPPSPRLRSPIGAPAPPPLAPVAAYPAPVKVDHPNAYTGKIGSKAKQWLTRMLAWTRLNSRMFPTDQEVLSFLLMNMKDSAGAWAHPHLDQLGSHQAIIQTVEGFKLEFLAAFGDPDATRAAERKITSLTQSGTCADYITKFRTLAMELDWNNAALKASLPAASTGRSLQNAALIIDNALREERASHPPRDSKSSKASNPARGQVPAKPQPVQRNSPTTPTLCWRKNAIAAAPQAPCIKCGKMGHKFAECRTGWKATPIEDKGKAKEAAKIGKDSKYQLGKE
ncbi:Retrotransposon gag protein [Rhizoctonia solani]|uniref:Retrotransposon gag protein n=1 Tax=Rhizoctonia solani TaxID=456999 RepID=A0A8H7M8S0_9AGAM|nr:Retrotransposon gag protein [Rhizoctonia solani]